VIGHSLDEIAIFISIRTLKSISIMLYNCILQVFLSERPPKDYCYPKKKSCFYFELDSNVQTTKDHSKENENNGIHYL